MKKKQVKSLISITQQDDLVNMGYKYGFKDVQKATQDFLNSYVSAIDQNESQCMKYAECLLEELLRWDGTYENWKSTTSNIDENCKEMYKTCTSNRKLPEFVKKGKQLMTLIGFAISKNTENSLTQRQRYLSNFCSTKIVGFIIILLVLFLVIVGVDFVSTTKEKAVQEVKSLKANVQLHSMKSLTATPQGGFPEITEDSHFIAFNQNINDNELIKNMEIERMLGTRFRIEAGNCYQIDFQQKPEVLESVKSRFAKKLNGLIGNSVTLRNWKNKETLQDAIDVLDDLKDLHKRKEITQSDTSLSTSLNFNYITVDNQKFDNLSKELRKVWDRGDLNELNIIKQKWVSYFDLIDQYPYIPTLTTDKYNEITAQVCDFLKLKESEIPTWIDNNLHNEQLLKILQLKNIYNYHHYGKPLKRLQDTTLDLLTSYGQGKVIDFFLTSNNSS